MTISLEAEYAIRSPLRWQHDGVNWILLRNRRRVGRVVPDSRYPKMYRSVRGYGKLSDMANLSRAKDAVLGAALRDLAGLAANRPPQSQQIGGVFSAPSPPMRLIGRPATQRVRLLAGDTLEKPPKREKVDHAGNTNGRQPEHYVLPCRQ